jgi:hypothetical protein
LSGLSRERANKYQEKIMSDKLFAILLRQPNAMEEIKYDK